MASSTVSLRLDDETQARLKALGETPDQTPHYLMKEAVDRYLEAEEADEAEYKLTMERWRHCEITGDYVDDSDVSAWASEVCAAAGIDRKGL